MLKKTSIKIDTHKRSIQKNYNSYNKMQPLED